MHNYHKIVMPLIDKATGIDVELGKISITTLNDLSTNVTAGRIALPEFQRPQVWNDQERKELVISLCLGVPIGSFLLWEYDVSCEEQKNLEIINFPRISTKKENVEYLLIDGQQRMTTISMLINSKFSLWHKVEFRKVSSSTVRPIIHRIPKLFDDEKKKFLDKPDLETIDKKNEMRISELSDSGSLPNELDDDSKKMALSYRNSLTTTHVPVHIFQKTESRQWVVYVYQTSNLAGKPLNDTDHAEAALGYLYPQLKEKIDSYVSKLTIWDVKKSAKPRKLILRSMLDELYNSPHFSYCKKNGLDVLNPRVIKTHANLNKKILEDADILTEDDVKDAFNITKHAFEKLEDLFISSWEINEGSVLLENEIIVMLAWYREYKRKKSDPSKKQIGEMSKHMMLSMALKPTTGGSTQAMTSDACDFVRESLVDCWKNIRLEWKYRDIEPKDFGNTSSETSQVSQ